MTPHLDGLTDGEGFGPVGLPRGHAPSDGKALRGVPQQPGKVLVRADWRRRGRERTLRMSDSGSCELSALGSFVR